MYIIFLQVIIFLSLAIIVYLYSKNTLLRAPEEDGEKFGLRRKENKNLIFLEKLDKTAVDFREKFFRRLKIISSKMDNFLKKRIEDSKNNKNHF